MGFREWIKPRFQDFAMWNRMTDGCHINRPIDRLVERGGFELASLREFPGKGPAVVSSLYRGIAVRD